MLRDECMIVRKKIQEDILDVQSTFVISNFESILSKNSYILQ